MVKVKLPTLKDATNRLEDSIITLSGPALAIQANSCYNKRINIVLAVAMLETSHNLRRTFRGGSSMNTLSLHADNGNPPKKLCTGPCGRMLPATPEFFARKKASKDGLRTRCKNCMSEQGKEYRSRPEVQAQINTRMSTYRALPEIQERSSSHYKIYTNRPEVRERIRTHMSGYGKRPERRLASRVNQHRYRARQKSIAGDHTPEQIQEQLERQRCRCYYCNTKFQQQYVFHIEHTFPLSRVVGTDIPANDISYVVLSCPECNVSKQDKMPDEWPEGGKLL
jgi:HNH endonuclease